MPILAILFKSQLWVQRGSVHGMQGDGSTIKRGGINDQGESWTQSITILVFASPTDYAQLADIIRFSLQSSTGSSITNCRFSPIMRWDHEGGHVRLWSSLGLVSNYVVLALGNLALILGNEGEVPHHMQGLEIGLRKLVDLINCSTVTLSTYF
jgi:hypothetical protein